MKKHASLFLILFAAISLPLNAKPVVEAKGAILIEAKTNTIIYEQNAYAKLYPASITKLMTALLVDEHLPDNKWITKSQDSQNTVPGDSSNIGLKVGDTYDKTNALHGLLLGSDNYIAHDLALATSGSISQFATLMNQKAQSLGAKSTHFVNPHGYHDPAHYTTPYDMALIAKAAFSDKKIEKIAGTASYNFYIKNENRYLSIFNTSKLLKSETAYYNPHVVACKTGFHNDAGQTIAAKAAYGNMELIAVVMNAKRPNQYIAVNNLFDYASSYLSVEKQGSTYVLVNQTVPYWGRKSIEKAVKAGWVSAGHNYSETMYTEDLAALLKKAGAAHGGVTMSEIYGLTGLSKGNTVNRAHLIYIIHFAAQKWHLSSPVLSHANLSEKATYAEAVCALERMLS